MNGGEKMNPQFDELTLSAYIDGELDSATMREVEAFLGKDLNARQYVLKVLGVTARLRGAMNATLHEDVPEHLIDSVRSHSPKKDRRSFMHHPFLRMAAAIVLVVLGFGAGTILDRQSNVLLPELSGPFPAAYSHVVGQALEFNRSGIANEWQAPQDALAVTVTPVKTYRDKSGRYFREYRLEIATAQERHQIKGLAYRTDNGKWKTRAIFYQ
jgi:anti-sigma factor RsiW